MFTFQSSLRDDAANPGRSADQEMTNVEDHLLQEQEEERTPADNGIAQGSLLRSTILPTLIISVLLGLVSGTLYGFGRYAKTLKEVLGLSQSQVQTLGIWMDCGNYVGHPLTGWIYDRKGPMTSCLLASVIVFLSYWRIRWTLLLNHDDDLSEVAGIWLNLAFCGVGFGSGLGYISGLGSTTKALSSSSMQGYFGTGIGMVAAGYGMSSTVVGLTYLHLPDLPTFFLFWALLVPTVNLCATVMFRMQPGSVTSEGTEDSCAELADLTVEPLLLSSNVEVSSGERNLKPSSESILVEEEEDTPTVSLNNNCSWKTWKTPEFWLLFGSFSCVTGCGLMVINNLSTIVQSMGGTDSFAGTLIIVLSFSNVSGRILIGMLGDNDSSSARRSIRRIRLLQGVNLIMAIAMLLGYLGGQQRLCLTLLIILAGVAYGGSWVLIAALTSNLFGKDHFGKDYGLLALGPALSGMIFNKASAEWYEQHTSFNDNTCLGRKCYEISYLVAGLVAITGSLVTVVLYRMQKKDEQ